MKILFCVLIIGLIFFLKPKPAPFVETPIKVNETIEFSDSELTQYNLQVWKRAEAIKSRIFKKYYNKYGKTAI